MKVILHTDDIGITRASTAGIVEAWRAGALDGFSVIANGDAVADVRDVLAQDAERPARIAVHFNLTEGPSSAPQQAVSDLVSHDGRFRYGFGGVLLAALHPSAARRRRLAQQVETECRAQIRAVREICGGRVVAALDGHNHVHTIPGVFGAVLRAAAGEGIPEVRVSREPFHLASLRDLVQPFWWINLIKHVLLRTFSIGAAAKVGRAGLRSPDRMVGILYTGVMTAARARRGVAAARAAGAATVELVFHVGRAVPGEADRWGGDGFYARFHLSEARDRERDAVLVLARELAGERA